MIDSHTQRFTNEKKIHQQSSSPILLSPGAAVAAPQAPSRRSPCAAAATGRPMAARGTRRPASFPAGDLASRGRKESRAAWIPAWLPARLPPRRGRIAGRRGFPLRSRRGSPKARMQDDEDDGAAIFGGRRKYREDERAVDREGRLIRGVRSNGSQRTSVN